MAERWVLLHKYLEQINRIVAPDDLDCRTTLAGRTMHFCGEDGRDLPQEVKLQLAQEALEYEQAHEARADRRARRRGHRFPI